MLDDLRLLLASQNSTFVATRAVNEVVEIFVSLHDRAALIAAEVEINEVFGREDIASYDCLTPVHLSTTLLGCELIIERASDLFLKRLVLFVVRLPVAHAVEAKSMSQVVWLPLHSDDVVRLGLVWVQREGVILQRCRHLPTYSAATACSNMAYLLVLLLQLVVLGL